MRSGVLSSVEVWGWGFGVLRLQFRAEGLEFRAQGLGFRVCGSELGRKRGQEAGNGALGAAHSRGGARLCAAPTPAELLPAANPLHRSDCCKAVDVI
eukprot:873764-Rhodomonas_salina.1